MANPIASGICEFNWVDAGVALWQHASMTLARYLDKNKMMPSHFAASIGVPTSTVTRWLSGDRKPSLASMSVITIATGGEVTINDMLRIQGNAH